MAAHNTDWFHTTQGLQYQIYQDFEEARKGNRGLESGAPMRKSASVRTFKKAKAYQTTNQKNSISNEYLKYWQRQQKKKYKTN